MIRDNPTYIVEGLGVCLYTAFRTSGHVSEYEHRPRHGALPPPCHSVAFKSVTVFRCQVDDSFQDEWIRRYDFAGIVSVRKPGIEGRGRMGVEPTRAARHHPQQF